MSNLNRLLVEGKEEKWVIPELMDFHVVWGDEEKTRVAHIEEFGGVERLLKPGVIEAELKIPGLQALGIIVDADDQFNSRWESVRQRCRKFTPDFPDDLPAGGLIYQTPSGPRIGVWIMPDNQSRGMLETFLGQLHTPDRQPLWDFARQSSGESRSHGAPFSDPHRDKADIFTYLAWLNPPGQSLRRSVMSRALDSRTPLGLQFACWFIELFQITRRPDPAI